MANKYDVVIIGAGIGGLTAALILAKSGKKVLVLEKNSMPGGYAINFTRKNFEFNFSMHMLNGCGKGDYLYKILRNYEISKEWRFIRPKYLFRSVWPDFDFNIPQGNEKLYMKMLLAYFPKEKKGIKNLFKTMSKIFEELKGIKGANLFPSQILKYLDATFAEMMGEFLKDDKLKAMIPQIWGLLGPPPGKISALYLTDALFDYIRNGSFYLKGGGRFIANDLVRNLRRENGEIRFGAEVKKIIIKKNSATGVILGSKKRIFADSVISNADASTTFHKFIGNKYLPGQSLKKLDKMSPSISAFGVFLGLNCDLRENGIKDYLIFVNPDYNLDSQYKASLNNKFENVFMLLTLYSNIEPNYAPKGKFAMSIFVLSGYDYWKKLKRTDYIKRKNDLAGILIKRAEGIIPGLSDHIEVKSISTPLTVERYIGSHKGALYGWDHIPTQSFFERLKQKSCIDKLYLAGAWTYPGTGIPSVMHSGVNAAKEILKNK